MKIKIKEKIIHEVEIKRDIFCDGIGRVLQIKTILDKDNEGNVSDEEIKSGLAFDLASSVLPDDFDPSRLLYVGPGMSPGEGPMDMGRPMDIIKGTITINLQVDRAEVMEIVEPKK